MRLVDADKLDDTIMHLNSEGWEITRGEYKRIDGVVFEMPTVFVQSTDSINIDELKKKITDSYKPQLTSYEPQLTDIRPITGNSITLHIEGANLTSKAYTIPIKEVKESKYVLNIDTGELKEVPALTAAQAIELLEGDSDTWKDLGYESIADFNRDWNTAYKMAIDALREKQEAADKS